MSLGARRIAILCIEVVLLVAMLASFAYFVRNSHDFIAAGQMVPVSELRLD